MAKKKISKPKAIKKTSRSNKILLGWKKFYDKHWIIGFLLIILAIWAIIWVGQVAVERYRFYQVEKKIDRLANEFEKKTGNNVSLKKERSCDYSSEKYGRGNLSCTVYYKVEISPITADEASKLSYEFSESITDNKDFSYKKIAENNLPYKQKSAEMGEEEQSFSVNLSAIGRPKCEGNAVYTILSPVSKQRRSVNDSLEINIGCYGPAKLEYFPTKN